MECGSDPSDRLRRLVEVGIALSSELSLETLLQQLIETAVELTGARYGALGVIDRLGTGLEQFITIGIDADMQATIGDLPRGRGILGVLIRDRQTLRLRTSVRTPVRSGFPPGIPRWPRSSASRSFCAEPPSATSTSRKRRKANCSAMKTRKPCASSPRKRRSRSRTHASTNRRGSGLANSSR